MKPRLVSFDGFNHLTLPEMVSMTEKHMEVVQYDPAGSYDDKRDLFVCNQYQYENNSLIIDRLINDGYKIVFDDMQEGRPSFNEVFRGRSNVMQFICIENKKSSEDPWAIEYNTRHVSMFFWVHDPRVFKNTIGDNESLKKYRTYHPTKKFLMLMNNQTLYRDKIVDDYKKILSQGIFTYVSRGITLPGDHKSDEVGWNRSVNVDWYNQTAFSVVVETEMRSGPEKVLVSEKTFKPMQLMHPFVIIGCVGSLELLKKYGFETFDNLFDETYDELENWHQRLDKTMCIVDDFQFVDYDTLTLSKLEHNHHRFYDLSASEDYYNKEVIDTMLEFLERQT